MNRRPLKKIAAEIATILKREAEHIIELGGLLTEAKEQLDEHGRWLPWLSENFSLKIRTAQKYMAASALACKYALDAHLLLTVSALYALVEADRDGHSEAVEAALCEAKVKWVDDDRVREIIAALQPPGETSGEELAPDGSSDEAPLDAAEDGAAAGRSRRRPAAR